MLLRNLVFGVAALWLALPSVGGVPARAVGPIVVTVANADREAAFYTGVLGFEKLGESREEGLELRRLTGIQGAQARTAHLRLGSEQVDLVEFVQPRGRPIPPDSRSVDRWFQHIAIVVRDMDQAYAKLRQAGVHHVSTSPQTLPAWNPNAGGIKAFYFQDPENHVLETIWFPRRKGDPRWQNPGTNLFLGIDHTAIVVADTEKSLAFYRDGLGLRVAGTSENWGTEQEHLNQVFGARLRITGLRAECGPGIEFLEYIAPPGGRNLPMDASVSDLLAWRSVVSVDSAAAAATGAVENSGRLISGAGDAKTLLVRDPDGHLVELKSADQRQ